MHVYTHTHTHTHTYTHTQVGFNGIIRPDHVCLMPQIEAGHATGEKAVGYFSGKASGYTMMGRIWAVG
jgi:mannonate dehydratase